MKFSKNSIVALMMTAFVAVASVSVSASTLTDFIRANAANQDIRMKLINFDMGTIYDDGSVGDVLADSASSADGLSQTPPTGAVGSEDTWGVFLVTEIATAADPSNPFYVRSDASKNAGGLELAGVFEVANDIYVEQIAATEQLIGSSGFSVRVYEQAVGTFDETIGSAGHTGVLEYTSISDTGLFIGEFAGAAGFARVAGDAGGAAVEFETEFDNGSLEGSGDAWLNAVAGSGDLADILNTNSVFTPASLTNGVTNADVSLEFTTKANNVPISDWLVTSDDPLRGRVIPLPGAASMGFGLMGLLAVARKRRNG